MRKKTLTVFAVLLQPSACLPNTHNANVKHGNHLITILSWDHLLPISSTYSLLIPWIPSTLPIPFDAIAQKNIIFTHFHCTASDMDSGNHCVETRLLAMKKPHLMVSATFLLACLPPTGNSWKIMHVPLQHLPSHSKNNRIAGMQLIDWSL